MSREDFEGIAQLAKENHKNRVAKNPDRIQYAIEQFEKNGIEYYLKNEQTVHFNLVNSKRRKPLVVKPCVLCFQLLYWFNILGQVK